ncbi:nucleotidyltransferase family protein [Anaerolinea thermophila]|uniref:nucleotidyltransferase family protein n=2 Tax=Anaerolinea TaxID=233189 RepID=UPI0026E92A7D|nr:nucleotidyltransferase family protein [Anaerolinea thermophila]
MKAILAAGGEASPRDPLYPFTRGNPKALLDLAGKPMVQWVIDALNASSAVESIVVVGLPPDTHLESRLPLRFLPDHHGMLENFQAGARAIYEEDRRDQVVLAVSSDIPLIRGEMVDWVAQNTQDIEADLYYHIIERHVMETRFPGSRRTYLRIEGREYCGCDLNAMRLKAVLEADSNWNAMVQSRKNPLRQARLIGWDILLLLLLGRLTIPEAERRFSRRMGLRARAISCPYAELGMDVDKPVQYELARRELSAR